jgi:hypothetical protein
MVWLMLSAAIILIATACTPAPPADDFAYADAPFTASLRGTYTPTDGTARPIAAEVRFGAPLDAGDPTQRAVSITFTQPPVLEGVTVSAVYETAPTGELTRTVTMTALSAYGEIRSTAHADELDGFLRFAYALLPPGDTAEISPVAEDGTHTVTRRTADGSREGVFLFSPDSSLPLRVRATHGGEVIELVVSP